MGGMGETQQDSKRKPWDQMPGEPDRWYGRFQVYLGLGPTRTLRATELEAGRQSRNEPFRKNSEWSRVMHRWRWRQRANAWDLEQRALLAISERNARVALHERRVERMEDHLDMVCEVLETANITAADEQQARAWLPQMRVFLRDLLVAERQEFERGDYERNDPENNLIITADDLRAAQRALEAQAEGQTADMTQPAAVVYPERFAAGRTLYVCGGQDSALMLDLAVLRAVRSATGLQFIRLLNTTRPKFATALRRERSFRRPIELLHLALHASAGGVEFADGVVDGNWLSERLFGVRILLLASCQGDSVGDWLGVVPYVITLSEDIAHEDAAVLTQHFWHNIGLNMEPGEALDEALGHCPPAVGEYVVRHW